MSFIYDIFIYIILLGMFLEYIIVSILVVYVYFMNIWYVMKGWYYVGFKKE